MITTPEFLATVQTAAEGVDTLKLLISTGPEQEGVIPLSSLEAAAPGEIVPRADSDLAALMYTGGTTGKAKGVMLSHSNLWWGGKASYETLSRRWHHAHAGAAAAVAFLRVDRHRRRLAQ